jgi:hypothetical protein
MKIATGCVTVAVLLCGLTATYSQDRRGEVSTATIAWGDAVNGLQLGIASNAETKAFAASVFDASKVSVQVSLRNIGTSPVRLLASVHTCLLGEGGANALLVSKVVLKPKAGGDAFAIIYKGWNHLSLLDNRRPKSEQPQQTLNDSFGRTDIQLDPDTARRMTTVIAPGETRVTKIAFDLHDRKASWWQLEGSTRVPTGTYEMKAVLKVDQELSEWKGELASGRVEIQLQHFKPDKGGFQFLVPRSGAARPQRESLPDALSPLRCATIRR